jgi:hypothetical protein
MLLDLRHKIEIACAATPLQTIQEVATLLHIVINTALTLVVDIQNTGDIKESNTITD